MIQEPDGYSEERIMELVASLKQSDEGESRTPDVILILNETFCDLRQVADIHANQEFLHYWDTMPNTVKGYAVAPIDGGGTNCSEYELLTGNSLQLMPGITPFYVLDLENANSIASHLGNWDMRRWRLTQNQKTVITGFKAIQSWDFRMYALIWILRIKSITVTGNIMRQTKVFTRI